MLKKQTELPEGVYLSALAQKTADFFGFKTKPIVVSNACVSGVMAIAVAKNIIQAGKYKDAFVIACDELSEFVISGFNSFQAIGSGPCQPYDKNRDGINIGKLPQLFISPHVIARNKVTKQSHKTKNSDSRYWEILQSMMLTISQALQEPETAYTEASEML